MGSGGAGGEFGGGEGGGGLGGGGLGGAAARAAAAKRGVLIRRRRRRRGRGEGGGGLGGGGLGGGGEGGGGGGGGGEGAGDGDEDAGGERERLGGAADAPSPPLEIRPLSAGWALTVGAHLVAFFDFRVCGDLQLDQWGLSWRYGQEARRKLLDALLWRRSVGQAADNAAQDTASRSRPHLG